MYPVRTHLAVSCSSAVTAVGMVESCPWDLESTKYFIQECVAIHAGARISRERAGVKMLWIQPFCLFRQQV